MGSIGDSEDREPSPGTPRRSKMMRWRPVIGFGVALLVAAVVLAWATNSGDPAGDTMAMDARPGGGRFAQPAAQDSNYCSLDADTVMGYPDRHHMQGSCCNPMDPDRYEQQVEGLKRYAHIPQVPRDPYDIDAGLAKELLGYDETITLDAEDHATFDEAMAMTEDGGPCCCQCWRWYMTSGLAKFLITQHDMPAEEVAEIVHLTNGCGGPMEPDNSS